jgi:DNA polymerase
MTHSTKNQILHSLYLQKSFGFKYVDSFEMHKNESSCDFLSENVVKECTLCDASKITKDKIYSFGNKESEILFVTTVPTMDKASHDTLVKMVENVLGIEFGNIYLSSIIKCDINEKSLLLANYISTCKGYILNQIDQSNVKIIVTLGDSYKYLTGDDTDLVSIRGTIIKFHNINLIPIYHPSFLLRNPSLKKEALDDLKKIKLMMER